jgi:recombination protein RecA
MTKKKEAVVKVSGAHDQIEKEFGNVLISGDVLKEYQGKIIPISLSLDLALNGGLPEGTVMTVSGVSGCGKTTLCLTIIANAQAMGKKCY